MALASLAEGAAAGAATPPRDIAGVWWIEDFDPALKPEAGAIPFTASGRTQYLDNQRRLQSGQLEDAAVSRCLPEGLPRAMNSPYPFQIIDRGDQTTFIQEANHTPWFVQAGGTLPPADEIELNFMGSSVGGWETDTFVISSAGFKPGSFIDATGLPHTDQLRVTQRLRRLDGDHLENRITIEDPAIFTTPWTVRLTYELRGDVRLMEFVCGEPHRSLYGERVKGARLQGQQK